MLWMKKGWGGRGRGRGRACRVGWWGQRQDVRHLKSANFYVRLQVHLKRVSRHRS